MSLLQSECLLRNLLSSPYLSCAVSDEVDTASMISPRLPVACCFHSLRKSVPPSHLPFHSESPPLTTCSSVDLCFSGATNLHQRTS